MKKIISIILISVFCISSLYSQDTKSKASAAAASSDSSIALSMTIWGAALTVGIVGVFLLLNSAESSSSH